MVSERLKTRLVSMNAILSLLDRQREETGNPNLGWGMEKRIVDAELADLEKAIASQESLEQALPRKRRPAKADT